MLTSLCTRENVHSEVYSRMVQDLIPNTVEQQRLFSAIDNNPVVRAKAAWCVKWIESTDHGLPVRLIAFAIVEGVFFSSSFAAIFWLRVRGLMPGLVQSNVMIARDEGMHVSFACLLFRQIGGAVSSKIVEEMIKEAVRLEQAFFFGEHVRLCVR